MIVRGEFKYLTNLNKALAQQACLLYGASCSEFGEVKEDEQDYLLIIDELDSRFCLSTLDLTAEELELMFPEVVEKWHSPSRSIKVFITHEQLSAILANNPYLMDVIISQNIPYFREDEGVYVYLIKMLPEYLQIFTDYNVNITYKK